MPRNRVGLVAGVGLAAILVGSAPSLAQTGPSLGTAGTFGVLAGSTVTNTGSSTITGDVGVSPGSAVVGFPPGIVTGGTIHSNDAVAIQAQNDLTTAYNAAAASPCTADLTGVDLGGLVLTPGVYCFSSSAQLTGTLTLNGLGDASAVFIFKIGSTLTTASNSRVNVINTGGACNVFWQVGSSATLGTSTTFVGNILALTSITLTTGAGVNGRALARNGAVTLDTNNIIRATCGAVCPVITLAPPTLPSGTVGVAYTQTITASGGTAPYIFSVVSGTLPPGLTLTAGGVLSGTPTTATTNSTVTIRATDANGCLAQITYTITIIGVVPTLPQAFLLLLAVALTGLGYLRLRRRTRAE